MKADKGSTGTFVRMMRRKLNLRCMKNRQRIEALRQEAEAFPFFPNAGDMIEVAQAKSALRDVARREEELYAELREDEQALHRIERGTYGICVECGEQICPARLKALPSARRCYACQIVYAPAERTTSTLAGRPIYLSA
jgi:RNA polymerase-binding transcription factor